MDDGFKDSEQAELIDLSSSSDEHSESSSLTSPEKSKLIFEGSKPLVLELHDITRNKQPSDLTGNKQPSTVTGATRKKLKKKKKSKEPKKQTSSTSPSDTSLTPKSDSTKEEFYDARESYHGMPSETQAVLKTAVSPTTKDKLAPVAPGGVVIQSSAVKADTQKKSAVLKPIVSPTIKDTPHPSVMVAPVVPGGVVIHNSAEQAEVLKKASVPAVPQTASDPLASTKTPVTKPTAP